MKKKLIIFCLILFFMCGCDANYNLVINDDNTINESITVLQKNILIGSDMDKINDQLDWTLIFATDETEPAYFYNMEKVIGSQYSGIKLDYSFNSNNFLTDSEVLKTCYENYHFSVNDERIVISAKGFKCSLTLGDTYNLKVNITAKGKLLNGNFDQKKDDTYIWNISNSDSSDIILNIDRKNIGNNGYEFLPLIGLIVVILLVVGIIVLIIWNKRTSNNKI